MSRWIIGTVAAALAACAPATDEGDTKYYNIAVSGPSECLVEAIFRMEERGVIVGRLPVWKDGVGTMEFGEVKAQDYAATANAIRSIECVTAVAKRPCHIENSDYNKCFGSSIAEPGPSH